MFVRIRIVNGHLKDQGGDGVRWNSGKYVVSL
jgi:hypothetical protein